MFTVIAGYNKLYLAQPITLYQGNFIQLTQTTARLAIDSSGATYSDLYWNTNMWSPLSSSSNWRFYLNMTYNMSQQYYQSQFNIVHTYSSLGLFNFSISINNISIYEEIANITDCK